MTDNIVLNPGFGGDVIAADDVSGVQHQLVKVEYGESDSAIQVSSENPLPVTVQTGSIPTAIFQHLRESGSLTGSVQVLASGSTNAPAYFAAGPPSGSNEVWRISRLLGSIRADTTIASNTYGDLPELTNGLQLQIMTGSGTSWGTVQELTNGHSVKNTIDWGHYCYDVTVYTALGAADDFMLFRWTFEKAGAPIRLEGSKGESLVLIISDDFTGLIDHHFSIQGIIETQLT